jgi:hypothetical protein
MSNATQQIVNKAWIIEDLEDALTQLRSVAAELRTNS